MNAWRAAGARRFSSDASRAYRELLNAQRELFGVDKPSRAAAVLEARQQFLANAGVPSVELPGKLQDALDAAAFLRHNVAQTVQNDRGNFELNPRPEHLSRSGKPEPLPDAFEDEPTPCARL